MLTDSSDHVIGVSHIKSFLIAKKNIDNPHTSIHGISPELVEGRCPEVKYHHRYGMFRPSSSVNRGRI